MTDEIKWRYWGTNDSEFARAFVGELKIIIRDCDGDFSQWDVFRNNKIIATGEVSGGSHPYHFDIAKEKSVEVAKSIVRADEYRVLALNSETGTENSLSAKSEEV